MGFFTEVIYVPRDVMIVCFWLSFAIGAGLGVLTYHALHDEE